MIKLKPLAAKPAINELSGQTILVVYGRDKGPMVATTDKSKANTYKKWAEGQDGFAGGRDTFSIKTLKVI